jgi:hypothetical protein
MFSYRLLDLKGLTINPDMPLLYELDVAIQPVRVVTAGEPAGVVGDEFASI